ncbi:TetR/AcrR family transcriptional regulator [Reichenbachiella agarivorans]|uniref:TetR/AcrR family transcriptional regulator n=1 Tax=Reichenbachiella agarivorans TaxID=2979464 RepID=A0ABY6CWX4_9BACT|nr:TetR/AcrR family transcriptional regulator [Reichenbachiella agarivorans]UXP32745.1 TetR/AcrR family transcriptional regulator [Reichenbachiella agarivorans]
MSTITLQIGQEFYCKDPQSTELGKKIVSEGIQLLDQLGFEEFTFKKLAAKIATSEASIYRYFDNKLKFLVYLTSWYWAWMEYMIDHKTHHINDSKNKLQEILKILCHVDQGHLNMDLSGINTTSLKRVVMIESDKIYLTKKVDEINNEGLFKGFKGLCHKISLVIIEINPEYIYPHALVSMVLETAHQQVFFAKHLPSLTEISKTKTVSIELQVYEFINHFTFKQLH